MIKPEDVPSLNDTDLMKVLRQAGLNKGPITSTTRSLYEKKLMKFLQQSKLPENVAPVNNHSEKCFDKAKPHVVEPLKESNKNDSAYNNSPIPVEKKITKQNKPIRTLIQPDDEPIPRTQKVTQNYPINFAKKNDYGAGFVENDRKIEMSQERIIYPSISQKSQPIFSPPLDMQRNRNPSRETMDSRSRSQTSSNSVLDKFEKKDSRSVSSKCANSTLPLQFKLINNDDKNTSTVSDRYMREDKPFLGYIRADRQMTHSEYLLNRRSIVKIDQSIPIRELNKSPEFYSKPLVDLSPQLDDINRNQSAQVSSSITVTKLNKDKIENSNWIKDNYKYLLSVFFITIIVYYCLQAAEEEGIVL